MTEKNKFMHDFKNQITLIFEAIKLVEENIESDPQFAKELCQKILEREEKTEELYLKLKNFI